MKFRRDHLESIVPGNRLIVVMAGAQNHRMGETALVAEPVIGLSRQVSDAPRAEELRCATLCRRLFCNRLDAIFAVFVQRSMLVGIRPGAAGAIESIKLIEVRKSGNAPGDSGLAKNKLRGGHQRLQPGGDPRRMSYFEVIGLDRRFGANAWMNTGGSIRVRRRWISEHSHNCKLTLLSITNFS
jgi:hypothetical protein